MKRLTILILVLLFVGGMTFSAFGGNSVTETGQTIHIKNIDSNFTYSGLSTLCGPYDQGARINFIMFIPGKGGCYVRIEQGSESGATIFYAIGSAAPSSVPDAPIIVYYYGARLKPVLDFSDSSVAHDNSEVIIQLWPEQ